MLLESPPDEGTKTNADVKNTPFPRRRGQEYYDQQRGELEAYNVQRLTEAEPIVAAIERRLHQEHLFARVLVETGIKEEVLRALLDRKAPLQQRPVGFIYTLVYETEWRDALGKLAAWLQGDVLRRKGTSGHAPTPTLKAIYSVLTEAMDHALLSVVVGSYGIGKSFGAERLVEARPRSPHQPGAVLVELRSKDNTVQKCIETLLKRLRHDTHGEGGYAELCRLLRPGDLLVLDEAQRLTNCGGGEMVEVVRDLWKDTGGGIALIGNPVMKKGGDGIVGNDLYGAFLSRAEVHDFSKGNTRTDVEAWMLWKGLSGKVLADKLVKLATEAPRGEYGGLRELEKLVALALRRHPGEVVSVVMLLETLKLRGARS